MNEDDPTAREQRSALMNAAAELLTALRSLQDPVNHVVNRLIEAGDLFMPAVVEEKEWGKERVSQKAATRKLAGADARVQVMSDDGNVIEKKRRRCSACGELGHRAYGPKCKLRK